jgi:hypothetical protein
LSPTTAGTLTATKPHAPQHLVYVAVVEHAHPTHGKLFVKVQNGYEMDELHNVSAQSPSNGQVLIYNASTSLWEKNTLTDGTGISITEGAGSITVGLASGYGDTLNPYASKTANYVLASPNGSAGVPTFRAIVAADIPTLNQNTTGTASNVTGTVAIANGGTGATSAATALSNLGAVAKAGDTMTGALGIIAGSASTPSLFASGDTNTGIFFPAADTIAFSEGGVESMRIDASGNVGIGATNPDIYSQSGKMFTVSNTATNSYAYTTLSGSGTGGGELDFGNQTVRHAAIASLNGSALAFYTNSTNSGAAVTQRVTIDSSGNVGIGTNSPNDLLEVRKDQAATTRIRVTNKTSSNVATASILLENSTSNNASIGLWDSGAIGALTAYGLNIDGNGTGGVNISASNASGVLRFATGTSITERMRIDSSGNVGIGTNAPGQKLEVYNAGGGPTFRVTSADTGTGSGNGFHIGLDNTGAAYLTQNENQPLILLTNATERARIDSSGNLLVGTNTVNPTAPFTNAIVGGVFRTIGTSGGLANGASATLFTIGVDTAYLVTIQTQNASGLSTTAIVRYVTGGNPVAVTILYADNAAFTVTVSGTAVRATNNLGGGIAYSHSSIRIY